MRRYVIPVLVLLVVLVVGAVGAPALPSGVWVKDTGAAVIAWDAMAPAGLPAPAVAYAADVLGGG
jgi:hypothetical protein